MTSVSSGTPLSWTVEGMFSLGSASFTCHSLSKSICIIPSSRVLLSLRNSKCQRITIMEMHRITLIPLVFVHSALTWQVTVCLPWMPVHCTVWKTWKHTQCVCIGSCQVLNAWVVWSIWRIYWRKHVWRLSDMSAALHISQIVHQQQAALMRHSSWTDAMFCSWSNLPIKCLLNTKDGATFRETKGKKLFFKDIVFALLWTGDLSRVYATLTQSQLGGVTENGWMDLVFFQPISKCKYC